MKKIFSFWVLCLMASKAYRAYVSATSDGSSTEEI